MPWPLHSNVAEEVQLLRFWEARNLRKGGELMSVDMLFVDDNRFIFSSLTVNLTQGTVSANHQLRFRERLSEGSLYTLTGFDVVRSNTNFRFSDAFSQFGSMKGPLLRSNPPDYLSDVIGELNAIRSTITDRLPGAQCVMLTLRLRSGENVCVSMFDSLALAFHTKLDSYGREPRVVIATSVNPKIVGGRLFLNGTSSTHLYFDSEIAAGKEVFDMDKVRRKT
ncbi:hypothetical protein DY000_02025982 [Brassica cretica]|uniref:DUF223 domain-containing protein n=1 Tax=Brassica cretica TaxID=69181 RepID=A0ABQ7E568_BRACR|nr:hypothetical protein DY000_02025982 [Brassica cretica]